MNKYEVLQEAAAHFRAAKEEIKKAKACYKLLGLDPISFDTQHGNVQFYSVKGSLEHIADELNISKTKYMDDHYASVDMSGIVTMNYCGIEHKQLVKE